MTSGAHHSSLNDRVRLLNSVDEAKALIAELVHAPEYEEMLARARAGAAPPRGPRHARRRDRHGLHIVRCAAVVSAGMLAVAKWLLVSRAPRAVTTAALMAVAGGVVLTPDAHARVPASPPAQHRRSLRADDDDVRGTGVAPFPTGPAPNMVDHGARTAQVVTKERQSGHARRREPHILRPEPGPPLRRGKHGHGEKRGDQRPPRGQGKGVKRGPGHPGVRGEKPHPGRPGGHVPKLGKPRVHRGKPAKQQRQVRPHGRVHDRGLHVGALPHKRGKLPRHGGVPGHPAGRVRRVVQLGHRRRGHEHVQLRLRAVHPAAARLDAPVRGRLAHGRAAVDRQRVPARAAPGDA